MMMNNEEKALKIIKTPWKILECRIKIGECYS